MKRSIVESKNEMDSRWFGQTREKALTRLEYKEDNDTFLKRKTRLCVRGDQQVKRVSYCSSDLQAPTLKAPEARLLAAITVEHGCPLLNADTRQAFLQGDMGEDDKVYIKPPDW